jgi:ArsR family transcriptional regulator
MKQRRMAAEELAKFFAVLAHPLRVLIVEELNDKERTVNELHTTLNVPHASVSQHLAILRNNRVVIERKQGRHVYYHLRQPELCKLVIECFMFISPDPLESEKLLSAIESARHSWDGISVKKSSGKR